MWLIYLEVLAGVNKKSTLFLVEMRKVLLNQTETAAVALEQRRGLMKELRGMRELRIQMRNMFQYDKAIILTTLQIIFQGTINMIITV